MDKLSVLSHKWSQGLMCISILTCISLLSQKSVHLRYLIDWEATKSRASPFYPPPRQVYASVIWVCLSLPDQRRSHVGESPVWVSYVVNCNPNHVVMSLVALTLGMMRGFGRVTWLNSMISNYIIHYTIYIENTIPFSFPKLQNLMM
jgi:hypothetical protein